GRADDRAVGPPFGPPSERPGARDRVPRDRRMATSGRSGVPRAVTRTESIRIRGHGGDEIGAFSARPDAGAGPARPDAGPGGSARLPGLVLVQEVFGLDPHIRAMAQRFADEGY